MTNRDFKLLKRVIAQDVVTRGIVNFSFDKPKRFKSGLLSPIYCDFRLCLADHELMTTIEMAICHLIPSAEGVIAGVATGALPHASFVARTLKLPMCYVRPGATAKDHGMGKLIEGAVVKDRVIYLIEDLVSTGDSVIADARILLEEGAIEVKPFSIFSYDLKGSDGAFKKAGLKLKSVLTIHDLLPDICHKLSSSHYEIVTKWIKNPEKWTEEYLAVHPQS